MSWIKVYDKESQSTLLWLSFFKTHYLILGAGQKRYEQPFQFKGEAMLKNYRENFNWVNFTIDILRIVIIILVLVGSFNTLSAGKFTGAQWITLFVSGLAQGSIYALVALGYTLVYGILLMINFAHGEVYMAGAFTTVFLAGALNKAGILNAYPLLSIAILLGFAGLVSMTVAVILERIAYRPLRNSPRLVPLIWL